MSDIRTLNDLQEEMSADFAWRKKELFRIKTLVISNKDSHDRDLAIRAAITLLYAHWEGLVKRVGGCYLEFVARRGLKRSELRSNFLAIAVSKFLRDVSSTGKIQKRIELVEFFRSGADERGNLDWKSGVNTKANLKSSVLHEIVQLLGLDYSRFSTKEKLLDEKLLNNRNNIAHGRYLIVQANDYLALHDEVFGMMQDFYNQVENAATMGAYLKPP